jgi:hypothetical protein
LNRKLGGPLGRSGRFGKESNSLAYIRIRTPDPPAAGSSCFRATDSMVLRINRNYFFSLTRTIPAVFWIIRMTENVSSPVTGLEWPRGFQEVKVLRFHNNGTGW